VLAHAPRSFAVLASGSGSNFEALVHASRRPGFPGAIRLLASDRLDAPVFERARRLDVPSALLPLGPAAARLDDERGWAALLAAYRIDAVLLAGFMRRLHAPMLTAFPDAILNLHPSLLPEFPGRDAIRRAFDAGVAETGCTVHVVTAEIDAGPIVARATVARQRDDTLERLTERIQAAEHVLYPAAARRYFGEPHRVDGDRVVFDAATAGAGR
jgi:phosphoribosylglycinamide formyltransferase 1